jgi:hypothetical protein
MPALEVNKLTSGSLFHLYTMVRNLENDRGDDLLSRPPRRLGELGTVIIDALKGSGDRFTISGIRIDLLKPNHQVSVLGAEGFR